jgi:hypothetical protein
MRTYMMMGLLLAGATLGTGSILTDAAQAQSQKGRPVATAKPSVNRSKPNNAAAARPAPSNRSGSANRANANQSREAQNRNAQNRNGQTTKDRNVNTANRQPRPGQPGYRGPDNVVIVNGNPGNGYYDNGRYYNNNGYNNNYDRYDDDDDDFLEFVGKTAAITAGVSIVSAVIGDIVQDKPSDDCQQQIQNGQVYLLCNGTWYTPVQSGGQEAYQVVSPPQSSSSSPPPINR